ncbi:MAG TPA: manganese efflux pump MntP family protein [Thermoanaerobaculia bacterium]
MFELLLIAVGLAMDCVAVSAARGVAMRGVRLADALKLGITFGGMQAGMAALGWAGGVGLTRVIEAWDHWIAFGLLLLIGGKMVIEGLKDDEQSEEGAAEKSGLTIGQLLLLGIATSIDSAAVGVTLPLLGPPLIVSLLTIGFASFALSIVAAFAAEKLAGRFAEKLEVLGGIVLIGIGVKILVEHLLQ